jgi:hypothetical protein
MRIYKIRLFFLVPRIWLQQTIDVSGWSKCPIIRYWFLWCNKAWLNEIRLEVWFFSSILLLVESLSRFSFEVLHSKYKILFHYGPGLDLSSSLSKGSTYKRNDPLNVWEPEKFLCWQTSLTSFTYDPIWYSFNDTQRYIWSKVEIDSRERKSFENYWIDGASL